MTRVDELRSGDQMWSPVGRWETVTAVEHLASGIMVRLATDKTRDGYAWTLRASADIQALTSYQQRHVRTVAVEETKRGIVAVLSDPTYTSYCWDDESITLAQATYTRAEGWTVADHKGDSTVHTETCASKAAARSAIIRAARAHAKGLGVKYRGRVGGVA